MKSFSIKDIAEKLNGTIIGNSNLTITGPEEILTANNSQITFIGSKKYSKQWELSQACAAVISNDIELQPGDNKAFIKVPNADIAMITVLELYMPQSPTFVEAIHPAAIVDATATIGSNCKIGAGCYVGKNVQLGNNVILYANVTILDDVSIGNNTTIWSGAVVRERCKIGSYCILHNNASIGADGFGFRPSPDGKGLLKIPHIGNVIIGNGVEIGANSCVDRGKFSATVIGDGCKIDNLVQIGHNSKMGRSCIMAGASGLAGSVTLGDGVVVGGGTCISDHLTIGSGAQIGGFSGVIHNVDAGKTVLGFPAIDARETLKQWATVRKLTKS